MIQAEESDSKNGKYKTGRDESSERRRKRKVLAFESELRPKP